MTLLRNKRLALDALLCATALILGYAESVVAPYIMLPGIKLGISNLAVMAAYCLVAPLDAAAISFARCGISLLLFGSPVSFMLSVSGAAFSFAALLVFNCGRRFSVGYVGVSVLCAALHVTGQCLIAAVFYGASVIIAYLPVLLVASLISGTINGLLLHLLLSRISHTEVFRKK